MPISQYIVCSYQERKTLQEQKRNYRLIGRIEINIGARFRAMVSLTR